MRRDHEETHGGRGGALTNAERRKEITEAFRLYARYKQSGGGSDPLDLETLQTVTAVAQTLSVLRNGGKAHIAKAVEGVYFVDPFEPLRKNDIERRVTRFSLTEYAAISTIYGWLYKAREVYWAIRHYE